MNGTSGERALLLLLLSPVPSLSYGDDGASVYSLAVDVASMPPSIRDPITGGR